MLTCSCPADECDGSARTTPGVTASPVVGFTLAAEKDAAQASSPTLAIKQSGTLVSAMGTTHAPDFPLQTIM